MLSQYRLKCSLFASRLPKPLKPTPFPKLRQKACKIENLNLKIFHLAPTQEKLLQRDRKQVKYEINMHQITSHFSGTWTNKQGLAHNTDG